MGEKTRTTMTTTDEGDCVRVRWVLRDALPSPTFAKVWKFGPLTDHYRETHFTPPGILRVDCSWAEHAPRWYERPAGNFTIC
jgi:hypothetical protein